MKARNTKIYRAGAVRDARGCDARPGVVAVADSRVLYAGPERDLPRGLRDGASVVDRTAELLMPALVNAHAHLDLTDLDRRPYDRERGDFTNWLRGVIDDRPQTPDAITDAVHHGLRLSREAGVGWLGDVGGSVDAIYARRQAPAGLRLPGVSYLECFGLGNTGKEVARQVDQALDPLDFEVKVAGWPRGAVLGVGPHAPYSVGKPLYQALAGLSQRRIYRLCTHLAESAEELEFVRDAAGPMAELLRELGKWSDAVRPTGMHPVKLLAPALRRGRWTVVHCNYVEDEHIEILERSGASVVYCPVASDYFGFPREGKHRYRDMLEAGVNVCLGTDSILCQPAEEKQPLGILPQMRYLYRRDGIAPDELLAMATTHGLQALDFDDRDATLQPRGAAAFTAVPIDVEDETDPLVQALDGDAPATLIVAADR
ncbi:MAG: amidohydrolase family protein [Phycisphaeraceae bacterium]